jgi:hypothetical protein
MSATPPLHAPLYRRLLGDAYEALPAPIRAMHDLDQSITAQGRANVDRGATFGARIIAAVTGFPPAGRDIPVTVEFRLRGGREIWRRDFAGRVLLSTQEEGRGRFDRLLCERFGPFAFGMGARVRRCAAASGDEAVEPARPAAPT